MKKLLYITIPVLIASLVGCVNDYHRVKPSFKPNRLEQIAKEYKMQISQVKALDHAAKKCNVKPLRKMIDLYNLAKKQKRSLREIVMLYHTHCFKVKK